MRKDTIENHSTSFSRFWKHFWKSLKMWKKVGNDSWLESSKKLWRSLMDVLLAWLHMTHPKTLCLWDSSSNFCLQYARCPWFSSELEQTTLLHFKQNVNFCHHQNERKSSSQARKPGNPSQSWTSRNLGLEVHTKNSSGFKQCQKWPQCSGVFRRSTQRLLGFWYQSEFTLLLVVCH